MPDALGHYKLLNLIGQGRLGELYRARDLHAGRTVALRVVVDEIAGHPDRRERFMSEARSTASLSHRNIATVYEVGEDQGSLFFASEYVPGDTLKTLIAGRALNPRHAIDYAIQVADALADGHAASILYRDLNPANVIVNPKGTAKVLEFGLAHWVGDGPVDLVYVSPELTSDGPIDQRADLYSLGVVLFEMLTGKPPLIVARSGSDTTSRVGTAHRSLPRELDSIVSKLMAHDPQERYQLAAVVAADLRAAAATLNDGVAGAVSPPPSAKVDERPKPLQGPTARPSARRGATWIRVALIAAVVIGVLWLAVSAFSGHWLTTVGRASEPERLPSAGSGQRFAGWRA
jgi:serine/threonine-protein kinase